MHDPVWIRRALDADAHALSVLAERVFRAAFAASNTPHDMQLHCATAYGEPLQLAEIRDPGRETWLAEIDGRLVAYMQLRRGATPGSVGGERPLEIQRFYVDAAMHGRGVAQDLMDVALARAQAGGNDRLWLGVWRENARAIAFYRRCGFAVVGEQTFMLGSDPQTDLVMSLVPGRRPREPEASRPSATAGQEKGPGLLGPGAEVADFGRREGKSPPGEPLS